MKKVRGYFQHRKQRAVDRAYERGYKWFMFEHCAQGKGVGVLSSFLNPWFNTSSLFNNDSLQRAFNSGAIDALRFCEKNIKRTPEDKSCP